MTTQTDHIIYIGDSRDMGDLADESVHLVITSPPYWQLKDYGSEEQIGFDHSYEEYINNLNLVWDECRRVLHKGCRLCINIGDQFARSVYYGRYKVIPIRTEIIKFCETIGLDYMGAIIWQKVTTTNTSGGASIMGSYPNPRNGILKLDYEFILIFKKPGKAPAVDPELKAQSVMTNEEWKTFFAGHWNFPGERQKNHLAMFPEELPRRLIKMFSFVGDRVLDPFLGSGTTSLAAGNLGRHSAGYEINADYVPVIEEKLAPLAAMNTRLVVQTARPVSSNYKERIASMPYIFRDPVKIDKKIDPRRRNFGSKVDDKSGAREHYYTVKKVLAPMAVELNDGRTIRLLGLAPLLGKEQEAVDYLESKVRGKRVYLRFDDLIGEQNDEPPCYLYLANRTFVNRHMIRDGVARVDETREFKYKKKFLDMSKNL